MKKLFLLIFFIAQPAYTITIGEIVSPLEDFLECKNLKWYERALCKEAAAQINTSLNNRGISLDNGDLVYHQEPVVAPHRVSIGHSCSHRAWINGNYATVRLDSAGILDFGGVSVSQPHLFYLELPASVHIHANLKEWWGYRIAGSCNKAADDHYNADLHTATTLLAKIVVSMEPKLLDERTIDGDYQVLIKPEVIVQADLGGINASFSFSGRSPFSGLLTVVSTMPSNLEDGFLRGEWDQLESDLGSGLGSTIISIYDDLLPGNALDSFINDMIEDFIAEEGNGALTPAAEGLEADIKEALGLDVNGERIVVVPASVVNGALMSALIPSLFLL